jgi:hypothetical protein
MNEKTARWLLVPLIFAAAGIAYWRYSVPPDPSAPDGRQSAALAVDADPSVDRDRIEREDAPSRPLSLSAKALDGAAAASKKDWPSSAKNEVDARWLASRFYPTEDDFKKYLFSGGAALPADLEPDNVAEILSAHKLLRGRQLSEEVRRDARISMENAATRGATYALVALGMAYENGTDLKTYIESQAYFRAAIMLGDWTVSLRPKRSLDTFADALASMKAVALLERMDRARAQRGLQPLRRDNRPGLESSMAAIEPYALMPEPLAEPKP